MYEELAHHLLSLLLAIAHFEIYDYTQYVHIRSYGSICPQLPEWLSNLSLNLTNTISAS